MVAQTQIYQFARSIALQFQPDKIILFGSYSTGRATRDSDVDILVIVDHASTNLDKAVEILDALNPHFAIDLHVRKPKEIESRIAMNDFFFRDIVERGTILYER